MEEVRCCGFGSRWLRSYSVISMALGLSVLSRAARHGVWLGSMRNVDSHSTKTDWIDARIAIRGSFMLNNFTLYIRVKKRF